ncbi:MAG: nucleotidyl transferase AbiEii/AbiGii toxin family protein [Thermoleophilia bacterium]
MTDELELIKYVASRLKEAGIEYMMTGSMAMAVYATPRMTRDIDMIIQVSTDDTGKIVSLFRDDFYIDETSVRQAVQNRGMFNIIHNKSIIKVDFIVRKDEKYRALEFLRRQQIDIEGVPVSIVAPEDLILSKLVWAKQSNSELQQRDVGQMLSVLGDLDNEYLDEWSGALGVEDLLNKAREHE